MSEKAPPTLPALHERMQGHIDDLRNHLQHISAHARGLGLPGVARLHEPAARIAPTASGPIGMLDARAAELADLTNAAAELRAQLGTLL